MTQRPQLMLKESYAILENFNILDIVESGNLKKMGKITMIIHPYRYTETETLLGRTGRNCLMHFALVA